MWACENTCSFGRDRIRLIDRQHRIVWVNSEIHGLTLKDLLGAKTDELCCQVDADNMRTVCSRVMDHGESRTFLARDRFKLRWWLINMSPAMSVGGDVGAVMQIRPVCKKLFSLSKQQRLILAKLCHGHSVGYVARRLDVTQNTIRTQLYRARNGLAMETLGELMTWALQHYEVLARYHGSRLL